MKKKQKKMAMKRFTCRFRQGEGDWERFEGSVLSEYPTDLYDLDDRSEEPVTLVFYGWDSTTLRDWFNQPELRAGVRLIIENLSDPHVRIAAADALGEVGKAARPAIPGLLQMLEQCADLSEFTAADGALDKIGVEAEALLGALRGHLESSDPALRGRAALVIGYLGEPARGVVPRLVALLRDPDSEVRDLSATALKELGPMAKEALEALHEALRDEDQRVRKSAEEALKAIQGPG